MSQNECVIGVDIGTTSTKTAAFDKKGNIFALSSCEYLLHTDIPTRAEQNVEEIYQAVIQTLTKVVKTVSNNNGHITAISFSSAMHSLIALDKNGSPITRLITWADQRASSEADDLNHTMTGQEIYQRTGTPIHPMSPLVKLIWFKKNDINTYENAAKWIGIKEYIFYRFFGEFIIDYSVASATGLFNLQTLNWDSKALSLASIKTSQLSKPVSPLHILKNLKKSIAKQIGISEDLPFCIGASDGALANLGVGAVSPGTIACSIGTSGAVRTIVDKPTLDPKGRLFCYTLTEHHWVVGGPINNGGVAFRWVRENIFPDLQKQLGDPYDALTALAKEIQPGAEGLLFLPYLTGERAPLWNAYTKGVFFGLTLTHDRRHMIRAVMEGVIFQMYSVVLALQEIGVNPHEFRVTGGFTKSLLWRQIMADIFEKDILVPASPQGSCLGAALLAMKALKMIDNFSTVKMKVKIGDIHQPTEESVRIYQKLRPIFLDLTEKLIADFQSLAMIQKDTT